MRQDLGIASDVVEGSTAAKDRLIYYKGRLTNLPRTLRDFALTPLFTPRQLLRDASPRMQPAAMAWTPEVHRAR